MSSAGGGAAQAPPAALSFQPTLKGEELAGSGCGQVWARSDARCDPGSPVMRLYKPRLFTQGATAGSLLPTALSDAVAAQHEFAMSSALILPDSFGCVALRWLC